MLTTPQTSPNSAAALVDLVQLGRREFETRIRYDKTERRVGAIPEGEATDEDLDDVTAAYMAWVQAWEALEAARVQYQA